MSDTIVQQLTLASEAVLNQVEECVTDSDRSDFDSTDFDSEEL